MPPGSVMATTRPSRTPTSAGRAGAPVPSTTSPPRISRSSTVPLLVSDEGSDGPSDPSGSAARSRRSDPQAGGPFLHLGADLLQALDLAVHHARHARDDRGVHHRAAGGVDQVVHEVLGPQLGGARVDE